MWNDWYIERYNIYDFGPNKIRLFWINKKTGKRFDEYRDDREIKFWNNIVEIQRKHYNLFSY